MKVQKLINDIETGEGKDYRKENSNFCTNLLIILI